MMKLARAIPAAGAVLRLTALVTEDEITEPIRSKVELKAMGKPYGSLPERAAYLVTCHRCVSIWAAGAVLVLERFKLGRALVDLLALSQAEILVKEAINRAEEQA